MNHMVSTFTTSDQVTLHFEQCQNAETRHNPIIFVHAFGASKEQYTHQQNFADHFCVVTPSLRGHGKSTTPAKIDRESMSFLRQAQDILELADYLDLEKFHYVGTSLGSLIGFELLRLAPERLLSLTTCGVAPRFAINTPLLIMEFWLFQVLLAIKIEPLFAAVNAKDSLTRALFTEMVKESSSKAMRQILLNLKSIDYMETLRSCTRLPILFMRVEDNNIMNTNLDPCLEELKDQRNIDIIKVRGTGRLFNMEAPEYYNQILRSFLKKTFF